MKALILLGCPETPSQTPMSIYASYKYFVTFYQLLQTKSIALVFEKDSELLKEYTEIVSENTDAEVISVRAFHNPNPIKVNLDKVLKEL